MRRPRPATNILQALLASALLVVLYYVIPVEPNVPASELWWRVTISLVGVGLVSWLLTRQIKRQLSTDSLDASLTGLLIALVAGVLFFALLDYTVAITRPGEFVDLETRTDALYFALSTLATVGFGDVHAEGQAARIIVIIQMLFNLVLFAAGGSVLVQQITARLRARRDRS